MMTRRSLAAMSVVAGSALLVYQGAFSRRSCRSAGSWPAVAYQVTATAALYDGARARGKDHPHAVRITARAWIYVIWRCWQDGTAYNPAKHRALQEILDRQDGADNTGSGPQ